MISALTRLKKKAPDFKASQNHIAKPRPARTKEGGPIPSHLYLSGVTWTGATELGRLTLNMGWGSLQWDCELSQKEGQTERAPASMSLLLTDDAVIQADLHSCCHDFSHLDGRQP